MEFSEELISINRRIALLETALENAILEGQAFSTNTGHGSLSKSNYDIEKLERTLADLRFRKFQITGDETVISVSTFVKEKDY